MFNQIWNYEITDISVFLFTKSANSCRVSTRFLDDILMPKIDFFSDCSFKILSQSVKTNRSWDWGVGDIFKVIHNQYLIDIWPKTLFNIVLILIQIHN